MLTHYFRSGERPFGSLTALDDAAVAATLERLASHGPMEFRLQRPEYLPERRRIERTLRELFRQRGGAPEIPRPHYFVVGTFAGWERDTHSKIELPVREMPAEAVSVTLTDSFFNFRTHNLHGAEIPRRAYHGLVFRLDELDSALDEFGRDAAESSLWYEPYVEAQLWTDGPIAAHLRG